ncbi:MAG: hypothetical protein BWY82_02654 [Verrucomicrobia bacterium ADurb.Bin474]|nr:MAG: hypothetical protein BWY82_02654 [Verrucomicrobia bacterium ADurb.Bin474]
MPIRKRHDVIKIRTPPSVNTLGIIPYRHNTVMRSDPINDPRLQHVRILILIHQNLGEALARVIGRLLVRLKNLEPVFE